MTRCIAIVTLALTAVLSADQAFAINAKSDEQLFRDVSIVDQAGGSDIYQQNEHELQPGSSVSKLRDRDDLDNSGSPDTCFSELQGLIAIIAFEYGPEAAYLTLRDMGFSDREADCILMLVDIRLETFRKG